MKSKKSFKKKTTNYRNAEDEIRIRERRKTADKKFNKHKLYDLLEEEDTDIDLYGYLDED